MYKKKSPQINMFESPETFSLATGLDKNNRWIKMAELIPWDEIEQWYAENFSKDTASKPAKSARMAVGSLIIRKRLKLTDVETVEMITENPYLQYFIGLDGFTNKAPMDASMLTLFRRRIPAEKLAEINEHVIKWAC